MDDIEQKRELIKNAYSSYKWEKKVDEMSPAQVIAIFIKFKSEGKIG